MLRLEPQNRYHAGFIRSRGQNKTVIPFPSPATANTSGNANPLASAGNTARKSCHLHLNEDYLTQMPLPNFDPDAATYILQSWLAQARNRACLAKPRTNLIASYKTLLTTKLKKVGQSVCKTRSDVDSVLCEEVSDASAQLLFPEIACNLVQHLAVLE